MSYNMDPDEGGIKHDGEKTRLELLPFEALEEVGKVLAVGAEKYSPDNWRKGMSWRRVLGSALRHLFAWGAGEDKDPESGLSHLAHAACCVLFLLSYEYTGAGTDDRWNVEGMSPPTLPETAAADSGPNWRAVSPTWWDDMAMYDAWESDMVDEPVLGPEHAKAYWLMYAPPTHRVYAFETRVEAEEAAKAGYLGLWSGAYESAASAFADAMSL